MKKIKLNYSIEIDSIEKKRLRIKLFVKDLPEMDIIHLFKGKARISDTKAFLPIKEDLNFLHVKNDKKDTILLEYCVTLGENSKFGNVGILDKDTIAFCGDQVFIIPFDAITANKSKEIFEYEITVDYSLSNYKKYLVPFVNDNKTNFTTSSWGDIFEFTKSSFVFSTVTQINDSKNLKIYSNTPIDIKVLESINNIYDYYKTLFKIDLNLNLSIINNKGKFFAGGSRSNICSSFDFSDKRDFKLIAKRLFLAFMQKRLDNNILYTPPNLWVIEGLTVYYENKGIDHVNKEIKKDLNLSYDEEYTKLYRLYIHSVNTNAKLYNFPPLLDGSLRSYALIEYLYNIKSPLLIRLFEENAINPNSDSILNELLKLEDLSTFAQPTMFKKVLGDKIQKIAESYIFSNKIIPLNIDIKGDLKEIKRQISQFENTMALYFRYDEITRQKNASKQKDTKPEKKEA